MVTCMACPLSLLILMRGEGTRILLEMLWISVQELV